MHRASVSDTTSTAAAGTPPNTHRRPSPVAKPVPERVTTVPPATSPQLGSTAVTTSCGVYWNVADVELKSAPLIDTATSTSAATALASAGAMHTSRVASTKRADTSAAVPKRHFTMGEYWKCSPVTVTCVPPRTLPDAGDTATTRGSSEYANATLPALSSSRVLVTVTAATTALLSAAAPASTSSGTAGVWHVMTSGVIHRASTVTAAAAESSPPQRNTHASRSLSTKLAPWTRSTEPPDAAPALGLTASTDGVGKYLNCTASLVKSTPPLKDTSTLT